MSKVEDNPHSRFVDYTCATDWETLINRIEATLRGWKKHKTFYDIPNPQASLDYQDTKMALALFLRAPQHGVSNASNNGVDHDEDPDHEQHEITRWFGHHNFLLLCPVGVHRMEDDGTFRAIFSALSVALGNMQFPLPCFMTMSKPEQIHATTLVLGHELYYLDGLFRHFELQLQSLIGEATDADRSHFTATVVEFYNIARPYWAGARANTPSEDVDEQEATHQPLIDAFLNELWFCAPDVEYSSNVNTLEEMGVEIWYKGLKRGAVVDNEYYSTLLPSRVPPGGWRLRPTFDDSVMLADSSYISSILRTLLAVYIHAKAANTSTTLSDFIEELDPERAQYIASVTSQSTRDKVLSIVSATASEQQTGMTRDLIPRLFAESGNVSRCSDDEPAFTMIRTSEARESEQASKIRRELDNWYQNPAGEVDRENNPRGMSNWISKSAPVGRLLSVFAVYAASTEDILEMAKMWRELTQEARLYCERGVPLPRMRHDTSVDHPATPAQTNVPIWLHPFWEEVTATGKPLELPDMSTSLLHQKFQMLQLCMLGQELDPIVPPEVVSRYTNKQVLLVESTRLARRGSHQQLDDPDEDSFYDTLEQEVVDPTSTRSSEIPELKLKMLQSDQFIRVPALQRRLPLTEDMVEQNQQLLSRLTGEEATEALQIRAKLRMSTIVSDMQAFKADNPESVLADFVRWYYPACWIPESTGEDPVIFTPSAVDAESCIDSDKENEGNMEAELDSDVDGVVDDGDESNLTEATGESVAEAENSEEREMEHQPELNADTENLLVEELDHEHSGEETKENAEGVDNQPATQEENVSTRVFWPGHGRIDESLLMGQDTDWRSLWGSATPCPAAEQPKLCNISRESEKVLNYIETLVPSRWAAELMCTAMGSLHFMVQDMCTRYRHVTQVQEALHNLTDQMNEAIAAIRDDVKTAGTKSNQREEAVCQRTLILCDAVCEAIAHIERMCDRLGSLNSLFPNQWRMLGALAAEETATATTAEEVQAINEYLKRCQINANTSNQSWSQSRELGPPSAKWFNIRCQARTTFIPVTSRDNQALLPPVVHRMFAASDPTGHFRVALRFAELE